MNRIPYHGRMDPQMASVVERQKAGDYPDLDALTPERIRQLYVLERRFWNEDAPALKHITHFGVKGVNGNVATRVYFPDDPRGLTPIVYLHGGGWVVGNLDTHDKITRLLAIESGFPVVAVDYSLAPEHKFPVAVEESLQVARALRDNAEVYGLQGGALALAGDSAGANMCAALAVMLQDESPGVVKKVALYYGAYGLKDSPTRRLYGGEEDGLRPEDLRYYQQCYLRTPADAEDPRYSILNADLSRFPPAFIAAAGLDPLLDDSAVLSAMLQEHGIDCEYVVYKGVLHGFLHMSRMVDKARTAINAGAASLAKALLIGATV